MGVDFESCAICSDTYYCENGFDFEKCGHSVCDDCLHKFYCEEEDNIERLISPCCFGDLGTEIDPYEDESEVGRLTHNVPHLINFNIEELVEMKKNRQVQFLEKTCAGCRNKTVVQIGTFNDEQLLAREELKNFIAAIYQ